MEPINHRILYLEYVNTIYRIYCSCGYKVIGMNALDKMDEHIKEEFYRG